MPKPASVPTWATTTNYATNPDPTMVGQPTKLDPGSLTAQGHLHITRPNPRHMNFWQNAVGVWLGWVNTDVFSTEGGSYTLLDVLTLAGPGIELNMQITHPASESFFENGEFFLTATGQFTAQSGSNMTVASGAELTLSSGSVFNGTPNFSGTSWSWAAPQINESTFTNSGTGHIRLRSPFNLNDTGAQTIGINNGDVFVVPVLSGTLTLTLSTTGAATGATMTIDANANLASGFSAQVTTPEGSYLMRADTGGTFTSSLDVIFRGGAWHTLRAVVVP